MRNVRIINEGGSSSCTKVLTEDGAEIKGLTEVVVVIRPNSFVEAGLTLNLHDLSTMARATFKMAHPRTGELVVVRSITFADGSSMEL